jgi:malto-oligosyltrehalose synthase
MPAPEVPRATYRLQLNPAFGFRAATALVPYLAKLGISHCYFSPYLKTRPGSEHGYDVTDHSTLNPELGEATDYEALCGELERHGMCQVLDIVPNHVGIMGKEGKWWLDVLENGQASHYASYFDIDWRPVTPKLKDKVLVPVLGDQYGNVLAAGSLRLDLHEPSGEFSVWYFEHRFPVDPSTYPSILQPGIERLSRTAADRTSSIELESIIRSLHGLPPHSAADDDAREVRAHETFIAKRRLADLLSRSRAVAEHVRRNVATHNGVPGRLDTFDALHRLLEQQPYRLAYWRVAADEINYRRFFDINDLAGLSTQNPEVLEATHRRVLEWVEQGKIGGLRIDHPDGLYNPRDYLEWLRAQLADRGRPNLYLVVEKILAAHEHLPRGWPVHGTTGYDFGFAVNGLFVREPAETQFDRAYRDFINERETFESLLYRCKQQILTFHLSSELTVLANLLNRLAEARLETRDFTLNAIRAALLELVAAFPVYRSYVTADHIGIQDRSHIDWAVSAARQSYGGMRDDGILDFVRRLLLVELPADADEAYRRRAAMFAAKFQQLTAPVMAKALEDTCFYRYVRLLSLNEVGGDPRRFGTTPAAFHRLNELRLQHWPHSMLGTSTHDSKRSEDVRARLNVLSEIPREWGERLAKWRRFNRTKRRRVDQRTIPSRIEEYLFYQTVVGAWPGGDRHAGLASFRERIAAYMTKALREAKVNTSWASPDERYEQLVLAFVHDALADSGRNPFVDDVDDFVRAIAVPGYLNGLSQTLLKLASPGVPDVYQGNELWDFSLVDPDNRRPVDYASRAAALAQLEAAAAVETQIPALLRELLSSIEDGRAKLYLTWRALKYRGEQAGLFERGAYVPLEVSGERSEHICAFARRLDSTIAVIVAGRWFATLPKRREQGPRWFDWGDTLVQLPPGHYRDVLTAQPLAAEAGGASVDALLGDFPAALLHGVEVSPPR